MLNHKVTINRAVGGHKKVSLAFYTISWSAMSFLMRLSTTVSVYCQADNNCTVSSSGNTDDNGPAVIFVGEVIKTVMKTWQLMVRM